MTGVQTCALPIWFITILKNQKGNNDAEHEFIRIFEFIETFDEKGLEFADFFKTNEEIVDNEFMETWVGPRKAEVTSFMGTQVEVKSAWISPHKFLEILIEHLRSYDQDVLLSMQYEDECGAEYEEECGAEYEECGTEYEYECGH